MSVEDLGVVDIATIDRQTGAVILIVSDHLDWSDSSEHQRVLQAKLNKYLAFVESGEILERYPRAIGRPVVFKVALKFPPDEGGTEFLSGARETIRAAGFDLIYKVSAISHHEEDSADKGGPQWPS
jgi:hypothetical protein